MVNDDVELEPRWLELLVGELERDPRLGFVTGKTLLYDDRELINETKQDLYTCGRFVPCGLLERDEGQWDRRLPGDGCLRLDLHVSTACRRGGGRFRLLHVLRGRGPLPADGAGRLQGAVRARGPCLPRLGGHDRTRLGGVALLHGPQQPDHAAQGHAPSPCCSPACGRSCATRATPCRWPTGMPPVPA